MVATPDREELAIEVMNARRRIHGLDDLDLATLRRIKRDAGINEAFAIADALLARLAAKPADEGVRIPYDTDARLGYVWLIWGVTKERVDLIAIATTQEACGRYLEAGKQMRRYIAVKEEQAFVDHLYGGGLLKAITNARLPVSKP